MKKIKKLQKVKIFFNTQNLKSKIKNKKPQFKVYIFFQIINCDFSFQSIKVKNVQLEIIKVKKLNRLNTLKNRVLINIKV